MGSIVRVDGMTGLAAAFAKLASDMKTKHARRATGSGAQVIKRKAKQKVRVADVTHTIDGVVIPPGTVRKNIIIKNIARTGLTAEHIITVRGGPKNQYAARIGSMLEHGTVKMSAKPFMRPALAEGGDQAIAAVVTKLKAGIADSTKP